MSKKVNLKAKNKQHLNRFAFTSTLNLYNGWGKFFKGAKKNAVYQCEAR